MCGLWCCVSFVLLCVMCFGVRPLFPCRLRTASLGGVRSLCVQRAGVGMFSWLHPSPRKLHPVFHLKGSFVCNKTTGIFLVFPPEN